MGVHRGGGSAALVGVQARAGDGVALQGLASHGTLPVSCRMILSGTAATAAVGGWVGGWVGEWVGGWVGLPLPKSSSF